MDQIVNTITYFTAYIHIVIYMDNNLVLFDGLGFPRSWNSWKSFEICKIFFQYWKSFGIYQGSWKSFEMHQGSWKVMEKYLTMHSFWPLNCVKCYMSDISIFSPNGAHEFSHVCAVGPSCASQCTRQKEQIYKLTRSCSMTHSELVDLLCSSRDTNESLCSTCGRVVKWERRRTLNNP